MGKMGGIPRNPISRYLQSVRACVIIFARRFKCFHSARSKSSTRVTVALMSMMPQASKFSDFIPTKKSMFDGTPPWFKVPVSPHARTSNAHTALHARVESSHFHARLPHYGTGVVLITHWWTATGSRASPGTPPQEQQEGDQG